MPQPRVNRARAPRWSLASRLAIPAFVALYVLASLRWQLPFWVAGLYLAGSLVCFVVYAIDKAAAGAGRWRISENTLILLGLAGGWPGAIVAQQTLRHKSSKTSFRAVFWGSVLANVGVFVACAALVPWKPPT